MTAQGGLAMPVSRRALLVDGTSVFVRPLGPWDRQAIERLHRELPPRDRHMRFGTAAGRGPGRVAQTAAGPGSIAVGAFRGERLVGVAYARRGAGHPDPEIAVAVAHREQARGIASLLLEHLVSAARVAGARRLTAEVLADNHDMLRVITDSGLPVSRRAEGDMLHLTLDLPAVDGLDGAGERYLDAMLDREERATAASLRPVLAPRSVAVIGAGRRPDSVGRALLRRIVESGFQGPVFVVHPHAAAVAGLPTCRSVADLPPDVDLAVLSVPGAAVPGLVRECGEHGIRAVLVVSAGVDGSPGGELAAAVEEFGLRLVGPNCLGLVDTDPAVS
ncbi:MAG: GNAT family N-acetyltransferase, partial [Pseudonocardia sp.]